VLRLLSGPGLLTPAQIDPGTPPEGAPFDVVGFDRAGGIVALEQRAGPADGASLVGDRSVQAIAGCLGAPAFSSRGLFGIVSDCDEGRPPRITLLSAASQFLRSQIPGWPLGNPPIE
jgi:hypothetical protein